jgi:ribose 5-phosphate isomerase B
VKVLIGADHGGYELKNELIAWFKEKNISFLDYGTHTSDPVDYPDLALLVAQGVASAPDEYVGIVIDGAGCGSAIAANKVPGVRAAACYCTFTAKNSRQHNAANVLSLGSKAVGAENAKEIVAAFLGSEFEGGRHSRRIEKIMAIEHRFNKESP